MSTKTKEGLQGVKKSGSSTSATQQSNAIHGTRTPNFSRSSSKKTSVTGSSEVEKTLSAGKSTPHYLKPTLNSKNETCRQIKKMEDDSTKRLIRNKSSEKLSPSPNLHQRTISLSGSKEKSQISSPSSLFQRTTSSSNSNEKALRTYSSSPRSTATTKLVSQKSTKSVRNEKPNQSLLKKENTATRRRETGSPARSSSSSSTTSKQEEKNIMDQNEPNQAQTNSEEQEQTLQILDFQISEMVIPPSLAEELEYPRLPLEASDDEIRKMEVKNENKDPGENVEEGRAKENQDQEAEIEKVIPVVTEEAKLDSENHGIWGNNTNNKENDIKSHKLKFKVRQAKVDTLETDKRETDKMVFKNQGVVQEKKDTPVFNDVIEETSKKLAEKRKSKVQALVGAFETVISLQEHESPMASQGTESEKHFNIDEGGKRI